MRWRTTALDGQRNQHALAVGVVGRGDLGETGGGHVLAEFVLLAGGVEPHVQPLFVAAPVVRDVLVGRGEEAALVVRVGRLDQVTRAKLAGHPRQRLPGVVDGREHVFVLAVVDHGGVERDRHGRQQHSRDGQSEEALDNRETPSEGMIFDF